MMILALAMAAPAFAQTLNSAYFMDGYKYRHRLNPAFASTRSYFGLPGLGGVSADIQSNMGISTFLYPTESGQLTTFMNGSVSSDEFLSRLDRNNRLGVDVYANILSVGKWGRKGFTSVELGVRSVNAVNLPKDLFSFVKNVGAASTYDISRLGVSSRNYLELAVGHAHQITSNLNIGAKVKFLVGLASVDARIDRMNLTLAEDKWSVTADGTVSANVPGLSVPTKAETGAELKDPSRPDEIDLDGVEFALDDLSSVTGGLGYGAALDLGAEYRFGGILEGLNVSAAILDLGFIRWGNAINAVTGDMGWEFDGFEDISFEEGSDMSIGNQFNALGEDLADLLVLYRESSTKGKTNMLSCTVNLAAEYEMPFYRKLSAGFLYSSRFGGGYIKNEGRFFVNLLPVKWFGISASYGISNFGSSLGGVINFDLPGFGLFIGTDCVTTKLTPPIDDLFGLQVPYDKLKLNLNFGLTFNISRYRTLGDWR